MIAVLKALWPYLVMHLRITWYTLRVLYSARDVIIGRTRTFIDDRYELRGFRNTPKRFISVWQSGRRYHGRREKAIMAGVMKRT